MKHIKPSFLLLAAALTLFALAAGCSAIGGGGEPNPTLTALSAAVAGTATAAAQEDVGVNDLATVQAEATAKSASIQVTQTARAETRSEAELAEATEAAPIVAELPQYGLDPNEGRMGWTGDPLTLEVTGYHQYAYGNDHQEVTAGDFVLASDITWDTQYGSSGCGFMFRSNGDQKKLNSYMILATRFATGHVIFTALAEGDIANIHDFYPKSEDQSFSWQNGTTNRLTIIARGNLIEIYTNRVKIGEINTTDPPTALPSPSKPMAPLDQSDTAAMNAYKSQLAEYQDIIKQSQSAYQTAMKNYMSREAVFTDGFLAMVAASESGKTVCTFDKTWLWLLGSQ